MASKNIGTLSIDLIAKMGGFVDGMNKAERAAYKSMRGIKKEATTADKAVRLLGQGAKVAAAGIASMAGITVTMVKSQANAADELMKTSRAIGVEVESLSALKYQAELSGVEFNNLATGLRTFAKNTRDASEGTGEAIDTYEALGISLFDTEGRLKTTEVLLGEVADAFAGMEDGLLKTAYAQDLLGRSGGQMINLLNGGSQGIADMRAEAESLGQVLDQETAEAAERFNDSLARINKSLFQNYDVLGTAAPALERLSDIVSDPAFQAGMTGLVTNSINAAKGFGELALAIDEVSDDLDDFRRKFILPDFEEGTFGAKAVEALDRAVDTAIPNVETITRLFGDLVGFAEDYTGTDLDNLLIKPLGEIDPEPWKEFATAGADTTDVLNQLTADAVDLSYVLDGLGESTTAQVDLFKQLSAGLEEERILLEEGADAAYAHSLRLQGLEESQIQLLLAARQYNDTLREQGQLVDQLMAAPVDLSYVTEGLDTATDDYNQLGSISRGVMTGLATDAEGTFDNIGRNFQRLLGSMADDALRNQIELQFSTNTTGGGSGGDSASGAGGAVAAGGWWAAIAVAAVAAVDVWNDSQDDKFANLTAEVRQGAQGTGTLLGALDSKSQSLNNLISDLESTTTDALDVNHAQLSALQDIRGGILGVAQGFARTGFGSAVSDAYAGIEFGGGTPDFIGSEHGSLGIAHRVQRGLDNVGLLNPIDSFVTDFMDGISTKITGELFKEKVKLTDSGIEIFGGALTDIIDGGLIDAQAYADITKEKKVFGISLGKDLETQYEQLDQQTREQLTGVFIGAQESLAIASAQFGIDFGDRAGELFIESSRLSLKDLEGDELTDEIESFFSAQIDNWADVLLSGTGILRDFQQVGEGSYETMVRLSSQTAAFSQQAENLGLNFDATGMAAVRATQNVIEAAGGYDALNSTLSAFTAGFVTEEEQIATTTKQLNALFGDLGETLPTTHEGFAQLVRGIDTTTEQGAELWATLAGISRPMDAYLDALKKQREESEQLARLYDGKMVELLRAQGLESEALAKSRELELAAMDESVQGIQQQIWALEDQAAATEKATQAEQDRASFLQGVNDSLLDFISPAHAQLSRLNQAQAQQLATMGELFGSETNLLNVRKLQELQTWEMVAGWEASAADINETLFGSIEDGIADTARQVDYSVNDIRESLLGALAGVDDWLNSSLLSDVSPLLPEERLNESRQQVLSTFDVAMTGDVDAIGDMRALVDQFLSESSGYHGGTTAEFNADWMFARDLMQQIAGIDVPDAQPTYEQQAAIVSATQDTALSAYEQLSLAAEMTGQLAAISDKTNESPADIAERLGVPMGKLIDIMGYTPEATALALDDQFDSMVNGFGNTVDPLVSVQQTQLDVTKAMAENIDNRFEALEEIMGEFIFVAAEIAAATNSQTPHLQALSRKAGDGRMVMGPR